MFHYVLRKKDKMSGYQNLTKFMFYGIMVLYRLESMFWC